MESMYESVTSFFRTAPTITKESTMATIDRADANEKSTVPKGRNSATTGPADNSSADDLGDLARQEAAAERERRSRALRRTHAELNELPSPGKMDDINKETMDTLNVATHDGVRFEYHKPVVNARDKSLTYSHLLWLGPAHLQNGASYEFATQLNFAKCTLMSQIDTNGMLSGRYHQSWGDSLVTKLQFAVAPAAKRQFDMGMIEVDYSGVDWSASLKLSHDSLIVGS